MFWTLCPLAGADLFRLASVVVVESGDGACPLCWVPKETIWRSRWSTWSMSVLTMANIYSTVADEVETNIGWEGVVLGSNVFRFRGAGTGSAGWGAGWKASSTYLSAIITCPIGVVRFEIVSDFGQDP